MLLRVGTMDLKWAEEFKQKLAEAKDTLTAFAVLAQTVIQMVEFLTKLREHPGVTVMTKVQFGLMAMFQTEHGGVKEDHILQIPSGIATAPVFLQALSHIAGEHLHNLKQVEQDTPKLQEILGAVSEFKDTLTINTCAGCDGCCEDEDEGPTLN